MTTSVARARASLTGIMLAAAMACGGGEPEQMADAAEMPAPTPLLSAVEAAGVRNAHMPMPNLLTSAQPTQDQFDALVNMGYTNFISLRPTAEDGAGWEEAYAASEGVRFDRIPVAGASGLTRGSVDELARLLAEAGDQPTALYCASSNRVGALLALKAYWLDGEDAQDALALGRSAGLASLETAVQELLEQPR